MENLNLLDKYSAIVCYQTICHSYYLSSSAIHHDLDYWVQLVRLYCWTQTFTSGAPIKILRRWYSILKLPMNASNIGKESSLHNKTLVSGRKPLRRIAHSFRHPCRWLRGNHLRVCQYMIPSLLVLLDSASKMLVSTPHWHWHQQSTHRSQHEQHHARRQSVAQSPVRLYFSRISWRCRIWGAQWRPKQAATIHPRHYAWRT